jgi:hypothetical protein
MGRPEYLIVCPSDALRTQAPTVLHQQLLEKLSTRHQPSEKKGVARMEMEEQPKTEQTLSLLSYVN